MEVRFEHRDDGQVDAVLPDADALVNHALGDSISSLPPRGWPGSGPSTYWIDHAEQSARRAAAEGDDQPFTWGNITVLRVVGDCVEFAYEYDLDGGVRMPLEEFFALLAAWRAEGVAAASSAQAPLPETHRRNPAQEDGAQR